MEVQVQVQEELMTETVGNSYMSSDQHVDDPLQDVDENARHADWSLPQ